MNFRCGLVLLGVLLAAALVQAAQRQVDFTGAGENFEVTKDIEVSVNFGPKRLIPVWTWIPGRDEC